MYAFLYRDGGYLPFTPILPSQAGMSLALGVNRTGDVVGYFYANPQTVAYTGPDGTPASLIQYLNQYGFIYSGGQLLQLPTLGGPNTQAAAINNKGDAVGASDLPAGAGQPSQTHAALFPHDGGIVDLGTLAGYYSRAVAINAQGQITGASTLTADPGDSIYHAFFYDGSTMAAIQLPGIDSRAVWIDDDREVVGVYRYGDYADHPFYYANGTATDLNALVLNPPPGMVLSTPQYINNQGQILVMGVMAANPLGTARTTVQFLLTPVPDSNQQAGSSKPAR